MSIFPQSQRVNIRFADDELKRFENMIGALGEKQARVGLARAVNRVTRTVHGRVIRALARQTSIPIKTIRHSVGMRLAAHKGTGPIEGIVFGVGDDLPLRDFSARQFAFGVKAKIFGKWQRFPGTFIMAGTYRSGQEVMRGHVLQRDGSKRLRQRGGGSKWVQPFTRVPSGVAIPDEMVRGETLRIYEETVRTMLPARAMHELTRLLNA